MRVVIIFRPGALETLTAMTTARVPYAHGFVKANIAISAHNAASVIILLPFTELTSYIDTQWCATRASMRRVDDRAARHETEPVSNPSASVETLRIEVGIWPGRVEYGAFSHDNG
jgi:hypothetical protein